MANPLRGEAEIKAGKKTYKLVFDMNALVEAEDASGTLIGDALARFAMGPVTLKITRAFLWAGLQRHHKCSLLEAGEIMEAAGAGVALESIRAALVASFPAPDGDAPQNPRKAAAGTGKAG